MEVQEPGWRTTTRGTGRPGTPAVHLPKERAVPRWGQLVRGRDCGSPAASRQSTMRWSSSMVPGGRPELAVPADRVPERPERVAHGSAGTVGAGGVGLLGPV